MASSCALVEVFCGTTEDVVNLRLQLAQALLDFPGGVFVAFHTLWCPDCTANMPRIRATAAASPATSNSARSVLFEVDLGPAFRRAHVSGPTWQGWISSGVDKNLNLNN